MEGKTNNSQKMNLDQAIQFFALTPDLVFVCKKIFKNTDLHTEDQWKDTLTKKGILLKTKTNK